MRGVDRLFPAWELRYSPPRTTDHSRRGPDMTMNSRRQFIASTAALATLPMLADRVSAQAPGRKLGVALCGLGSLSTNQIAPALLKTRNCRLAGIVTGTPSKAEEWQKKYDIPAGNVYT